LESDSYACFTVSDLSKDQRFRDLPYVAGPPYMKFYAGTPLLTESNVPIGSVLVIDSRPRGPPDKFEIDLLGVMARNVMEYLEMRRESEM
jgi:GAF domain-containing protein